MEVYPTSWVPVISPKDLSRATLYIFCENSICIHCPLVIPQCLEFKKKLTENQLKDLSENVIGSVVPSSTNEGLYYIYGDIDNVEGDFKIYPCPPKLYLASQIFFIRHFYPDFHMYSGFSFDALEVPEHQYSNMKFEYVTDISLIRPIPGARQSKGECLFWDIEVVSNQKPMCEAIDPDDQIYAISIAYKDRLIVLHTTSFSEARISREVYPINAEEKHIDEKLATFMNSALQPVRPEFSLKPGSSSSNESLLREIECIQCQDEYECIQSFVDLVEMFDPDYLCSYNGYGFDEDYFAERLYRHYNQVVPNLTRLVRPYQQFLHRITFTPWGKPEVKMYIPTYGRESIDMMKFYQLYIYSYRYKLDVIARHYLNDSKLDLEISTANAAVLSNDERVLRTVLQYSGKDCLLLQQLEERTHMMNKLKDFASKCSMTLTNLLTKKPEKVILLILASIDLRLNFKDVRQNAITSLPVMEPGIYRNTRVVDISNLLVFLLQTSQQNYAEQLARIVATGPHLLKLAAFQCGHFDIAPMIERLKSYTKSFYGIHSSIGYVSSNIEMAKRVATLGSYRMIVFISNKSLIYLNDDNTYSYRGTSRLTYHRFPFIRHLIEYTLNSRANLPLIPPVLSPENLWITEKIDLARPKIDKEIDTDFDRDFGITPVDNYVQRYKKNSYRDLLMQQHAYLNEGYSHLVQYLVTTNGPVLRGTEYIDEAYYLKRINIIKEDLLKLRDRT